MSKDDEQAVGLLAEEAFEEATADVEATEVATKDAKPSWIRSNIKTVAVALLACLTFIVIWLRAVQLSRASDVRRTSQVVTPLSYPVARDWDYGAEPTRREYHWTVTDVEFNPDGVYRPMMVINGQYPGPLIEVNDGDTIAVHVDNQAANATAIHWHGLYQNGSAWMDGTVGITQCPIAPGNQFTYEFKISGQSGTYWYHSHQGVQASDGLVGPLIIHSQEELKLEQLEYASDQVVMVSDHYHNLTSELIMKYLASDNENAEPVPDGALINGRGVTDCSKYANRKCDNSTANVGNPQFTHEANKNHKLRFINVRAFDQDQIAIDGHQFAIVEVDGTVVKPKYYDRFTINAAQRYSIVVTSNVTLDAAYWLRAKMLTACFTDPPKHMDGEVRAIVAYGEWIPAVGIPKSHEVDESVELVCRDMNTTELEPARVIAAPAKADTTIYLRANFEIGDWRLSRGVFNQSSWRADVQNPSLFRAVDGLASQNVSFTKPASSENHAFVNDIAFNQKRELVIQTAGIQIIDIIVTNFDDGNHPLHLHGYKYFVLGQGHGYPPADLTSTVDLSNPLRRDTASVEAFGWLFIRLIADNPGAWAFHCHISWHTEAGLLMQFLTRTEILSRMSIPQPNRDLCGAPVMELRKGAGPEDQVFFGSTG